QPPPPERPAWLRKDLDAALIGDANRRVRCHAREVRLGELEDVALDFRPPTRPRVDAGARQPRDGDEHPPAADARQLLQRRHRVRHMLERLAADDDVERAVGKRQTLDVGDAGELSLAGDLSRAGREKVDADAVDRANLVEEQAVRRAGIEHARAGGIADALAQRPADLVELRTEMQQAEIVGDRLVAPVLLEAGAGVEPGTIAGVALDLPPVLACRKWSPQHGGRRDAEGRGNPLQDGMTRLRHPARCRRSWTSRPASSPRARTPSAGPARRASHAPTRDGGSL